jgi:hypothetical protein
MENYSNPFTGSKTKITERITEDDLPNYPGYVQNFTIENHNIEDQNERYLLYESGLLVRKTKSEKKYFM